MAKRKQYIIDKKFQLKTTFSIIGVMSLITTLIIGAIAASVAYNNTRIENIYKIEDNIVHFLTSRPHEGEDEVMKNAMREIAVNHSNNMMTLHQIIKYNHILIYSLIAMIFISGILLYVVLIRHTHRISGPIYVMSKYMRDIIDGNYPVPRPLRDKDQLKDFYATFVAMVNTIQEREEALKSKKKKK